MCALKICCMWSAALMGARQGFRMDLFLRCKVHTKMKGLHRLGFPKVYSSLHIIHPHWNIRGIFFSWEVIIHVVYSVEMAKDPCFIPWPDNEMTKNRLQRPQMISQKLSTVHRFCTHREKRIDRKSWLIKKANLMYPGPESNHFLLKLQQLGNHDGTSISMLRETRQSVEEQKISLSFTKIWSILCWRC